MSKFLDFVEQIKAAAIISILVGLVFRFGFLFFIKRGILIAHPQTDNLTSDRIFFIISAVLFSIILFITHTREKI